MCSSPAIQLGLRSIIAGDPAFIVVYEYPFLNEALNFSGPVDVLIYAHTGPHHAPASNLLQQLDASVALLVLDQNVARWINLNLGLRRGLGFVPLESSTAEIHAAVHAVHANLWVSPAGLIHNRAAPGPEEAAGIDDPLTAREMEILQHLAQGQTNRQIAFQLSISDNTVKYHISSIFSKLGVNNRAEAVRQGIQKGWIAI
ncbi:MAG: response regulator transcription factor [Anaerolineaceae bacterium]|nr:response regulator transcription factor [Anaerolineaceae bacterium]